MLGPLILCSEPVRPTDCNPAPEIVTAVNAVLDAAPFWPGALTFALRKLLAEHPEWNADDVWAAVEQRQAARRAEKGA